MELSPQLSRELILRAQFNIYSEAAAAEARVLRAMPPDASGRVHRARLFARFKGLRDEARDELRGKK